LGQEKNEHGFPPPICQQPPLCMPSFIPLVSSAAVVFVTSICTLTLSSWFVTDTEGRMTYKVWEGGGGRRLPF